MKKKTLKAFLLMVVLVFASCKQKRKTQPLHSIKDKHSQTLNDISHLKNKLKTPNDKDIMVIAHRGDWRNAPENSLQAIQNCIDMGVDMVEIDVRTTKDGHLVLMHDQTVDRTTTGKGKVSEITLDSLQTLYLKNGANHPTHHKIPTLEEAMQVAKDKILVNLDKSYQIFDKVYEVLQKTGTTDQVVMKGKVLLPQVKQEFGKYLDKVTFMPIVNVNEPNAEQIIDVYLQELKPVAFEVLFKKETPKVYELIRKINDAGSRVWVNTLWKSLNAGYDDDTAIKNTDSIYGFLIKKGTDMIQTDRPQLLLDYLRKKELHE